LRSLEINPNNAACLQEYGNFLTLRKGSHEDAEKFFLRSSKCTELYLASEEAATKEPVRSMTRHIRHGSSKDVLQLLRHADNDFRERARSEIDLVSSPTLKVNSDEVMVPERKGKEKTSRRSLSYGDEQLVEERVNTNENQPGEKEEQRDLRTDQTNREDSDEDGYENDEFQSEEEGNEDEENGYEGLDGMGGVDEDEHGGEADVGDSNTTTTTTTGHMYSNWGPPMEWKDERVNGAE